MRLLPGATHPRRDGGLGAQLSEIVQSRVRATTTPILSRGEQFGIRHSPFRLRNRGIATRVGPRSAKLATSQDADTDTLNRYRSETLARTEAATPTDRRYVAIGGHLPPPVASDPVPTWESASTPTLRRSSDAVRGSWIVQFDHFPKRSPDYRVRCERGSPSARHRFRRSCSAGSPVRTPTRPTPHPRKRSRMTSESCPW
jgi:hypothetical protein